MMRMFFLTISNISSAIFHQPGKSQFSTMKINRWDFLLTVSHEA